MKGAAQTLKEMPFQTQQKEPLYSSNFQRERRKDRDKKLQAS